MGIICLETEWEHTNPKNSLSIHSEPLLAFIGKAWKCKTIYRRVATLSELQFYLKKFKTKKYNEYTIFYLSFHGNTRAIQLEGHDEILTLDALAELADGCFENRHLHFSSCRTLIGSEAVLGQFKSKVKARSLSGYTKKVNGILSAINDIAYFDQILRHPIKPGYAGQSMSKYYEGLGKELGFRII